MSEHKQSRPSYADVYFRLKSAMSSDLPGIRDFSRRHPSGTLADFGAGFGRIVGANLKRPLILIENDPEMLAILRERVAGHEDIEIREASGLATELPDASVGAVTMSYASLAEMRPIAFALAEAARVLEPGGGLYLMMYNPEYPEITNSGLQRPAIGSSDFSASLLTMPLRQYGECDYMTTIEVRSSQGLQSYSVRQTFPSASILTDLLQGLGFVDIEIFDEITGGPATAKESRLFRITASKSKAPAAAVYQPELRDFYDKIADSYDNIMENGRYEGMTWLKSQLSSWKGLHAKVLDLGCGNGVAIKTLREIGVTPTAFGIDLSSHMLTCAQATGRYAALLRWDLARGLPVVEGGEFDLAVAMGVCEFLHDLPTFFSSLRRSLAVGGRALITLELLEGGGDRSDVAKVGTSILKHRYTRDAANRLLDKAGFSLDHLSEGFAYRSPSLGSDVCYIFANVSRTKL